MSALIEKVSQNKVNQVIFFLQYCRYRICTSNLFIYSFKSGRAKVNYISASSHGGGGATGREHRRIQPAGTLSIK